MHVMIRSALAILSMMCATASFADQTTGTGNVGAVYTMGDGTVYVMGLTFSGSACTNSSAFAIPPTHPYFNRLLSQVLYAKAVRQGITVVALTWSGCTFPTLSSDQATYIYLN